MSKNKNLGTIEKLMDGFNPYQSRIDESRGLVNKWEPTGLLEGIKDEQKVLGMSVLLENQARQLIDEASKTGTSSNSEEWSGVALPLVRKIFGELASQEFVSVQPMNLPSGLIFYLDFKYGTAQAGVGTGEQVFGVTSGSGDPTGGLYGAGKFGYSINDVRATINNASSIVSASATWADVDFEPDLSSSVAAGNLVKMTVPKASISSVLDETGVRAFSITGSNGSAISTTYPAYQKMSGTNVVFIVDPNNAGTTLAAFTGSWEVKYHKAPTDTTRGDFEQSATGFDANPETDVDIPEIDISLKSVAIVAKTRKLKAVWSPELAQDLNAYHSVDAEAELTAMLSEYISMEIDLEILDMLMAGASAKEEKWSARVGYEFDSATSSFIESSGASNAYTKGDWFQTLGNKIQAVSNAIHQKTLRGGANFMVVSPETATIREYSWIRSRF